MNSIIYYYRRSAAKSAARLFCELKKEEEKYQFREVKWQVPSIGPSTGEVWHASLDYVMRYDYKKTPAKLSAFEVEGDDFKMTYAYVVDDGDYEISYYEVRCDIAKPSEFLKAYGALFDDSCPVLLSQATDDQLALELNLRGWKGELERTDIRHLQV